MSESDTQLSLIRDPRLSPHALSALPAWLWRADASRILWSNPAGAALLGATDAAALRDRVFDRRHPVAAQVARLAPVLPRSAQPRLERLRGFGPGVGGFLTCRCMRLVLPDATTAILVLALHPAGAEMPFETRATLLVEGLGQPAALFSRDGRLLYATADARARLGGSVTASEAQALAGKAMAENRASGTIGTESVVLDRIGEGAESALLLTFDAVGSGRGAAAPAPHEADPAPAEPAAEVLEPSPPASRSPAPAMSTNAAASPTNPASGERTEAKLLPERRWPLRFVWQIDADGRFTLGSDEFGELIGDQIAGSFGRPWSDIATELNLDPEGLVEQAMATRNTWSGVVLHWPVDGSEQMLAVEMSGLPVFDSDRAFRGYKGFGVCRDTDRLASLARIRRGGAREAEPQQPRAPISSKPVAAPAPATPVPVANVVSFPTGASDTRPPALSPIEHNAFEEIARRLQDLETRPPAAPADSSASERQVLDRFPIGVLVYRHDQILYANPAFLAWSRHSDLAALAADGGLDGLMIELRGGDADGDAALTVASPARPGRPSAARLVPLDWLGDTAQALVLMPDDASGTPEAPASRPEAVSPDLLAQAQAQAREYRAVLDAAADGVLTVDPRGTILEANSGAERLLGHPQDELTARTLSDLLRPGSERLIATLLEQAAHAGPSGAPRRSVNAVTRDGKEIALSMAAAPGGAASGTDGPARIYTVLRDVSSWKKTERDLTEAKREADKASAAKSDFLAKISHEIRTPLNAIIGFSEVMMAERFGPIGNDRYRAYLRDIHTSGEHLVSLLNDLLDLSKIEAGKLELNFTNVGLNDLTQQCVAIMQGQANKEQIIIRTSFFPKLPQIVADARSVRQIVLNLLSNSIKFTGAGGQVIVSSALNDNGQVVLRVRDTGVGMSEEDLAIALEPFRQVATSARTGPGGAGTGTGLGLPLTKALAEANHAAFSITSARNSGTLVEVAFQPMRASAE